MCSLSILQMKSTSEGIAFMQLLNWIGAMWLSLCRNREWTYFYSFVDLKILLIQKDSKLIKTITRSLFRIPLLCFVACLTTLHSSHLKLVNLLHFPKYELLLIEDHTAFCHSSQYYINICYSPGERSVLGTPVPEVLRYARQRVQFFPIRTDLSMGCNRGKKLKYF